MVLIEYYHLSSIHALFSPVHLLCAFNISPSSFRDLETFPFLPALLYYLLPSFPLTFSNFALSLHSVSFFCSALAFSVQV